MSESLAMGSYSISQSVEIDAGDWVEPLTFTPDGEYLVSGGSGGVRVWRVKDSERVAMMKVRNVRCLAVSKDGRFIAAGSNQGDVLVWDGTTYEQVFSGKIEQGVWDVDFSPDSKQLVSADGHGSTATIWNIATRQAQTLHHGRPTFAAKYSPRGHRIATATWKSVRVLDSSDGQLLVGVRMRPDPWGGLLWSNNHLLFVKSKYSEIRQIDTSTGSTVSEWSVPYDDCSCIALPQHGQFIAYSTRHNITLWDTSTHTRVSRILQGSHARSIAFSEDGRLAIVASTRKIAIKDFYFIGEPDIRIENAPLHAWKKDQLMKAEALLTAIPRSKDTAHNVLASRALVRARLRKWDTALIDAEESIEIQASPFGYIAKCVTLVGKGDAHAACRVCDIACLLFQNHAAVLLLIKAVVLSMAGEHQDAISRIGDLIAVRPSDPTLYVVQAYMYYLHGDLYMERGDYNLATQSFENARLKLGGRKERPPLIVSLISGWKFDDLAITIQLRLCETLLSVGRVREAGDSVLRMVGAGINLSASVKTWVGNFIQQCLSALESTCDANFATPGHNCTSHYVLPLLKEWAKLRLSTESWKDALASAAGFMLQKFMVYQVICDHLEMTGHPADAVACFHQMGSECAQETDHEQVDWILDFRSRCSRKLANLGDNSMNANEWDEAILQYTTALSLNPIALQDLLSKRSKAHAGKEEWVDALKDAEETIKLDPSSPLGYERRHEALCGKGFHDDATRAFQTMLSKMSDSSDPDIRERSHRYIRPEKTREIIRIIIDDALRESPLVLINTASGRLCNKLEQACTFETTPIFTELVSSVTAHIDHARVEQEVVKYFQYATFSHKWEDNEPLFEKVIRIVVYDLEASPTHEKLQMFCKIVREAGYNWAWSDTCCIDKGDHFVLQEALVSMFKWYERSAMTLIYLRGVPRLALRGALTRSLWNMRAWTLQEYHASKVVRIYTEDWTPYLGLEIYNHKESPEIISEMEEATGISAQALKALRPGLDDIREKLRLASTRQTTRIEDTAYSLLGIFSLSLPITYGEGDRALGRLLSQLLASSGDMSILAWTGTSGNFNSCLPSSIAVFSQPPATHVPPAISAAEINAITVGLRSLSFNLLTKLYDRVNELPVPSFSGLRMRLPCLAFKLGHLSVSRKGGYVSRAQTNALGVVEIRSDEDISQLGSLYLVHPWIDSLLDKQPVEAVSATELNADDKPSLLGDFPNPSNIASTSRQTRAARLISRMGLPFVSRSALDTASLLPPSTLSPAERQARVLQFIARLRQPFGALLLTPIRRNADEYRRVAPESLIKVQVEEITPVILDKLMDSVKILDVL